MRAKDLGYSDRRNGVYITIALLLDCEQKEENYCGAFLLGILSLVC